MEGTGRGEKRVRSDVREAFPLEKRARLAIALLALVALADLFAIWADLELLDLTNRVLGGERVSLAEARSVDDRTSTTGLVQTVLYIVSAISFLLWYSRAYRNVIAMGAKPPRYGTRWAVWYWFLPIVNLFRPKQVMNDIWRGSDPDMRFGDPGFPKRPTIALLWFWWAGWLIANVIGRAASRLSLDAQTLTEIRTQAQVYLASDIADLITALLAIAVVWKLTQRQEERLRRFGEGTLEGQTGPGELATTG